MKKIFAVILGCAIATFGLNCFLIPNSIAPGGFSGIGILINTALGLPVGITLVVLNIPLFIAAFKMLGKGFVLFSLFATGLYSVLIDAFAFLPTLTIDPVLASVYGGICVGIGYGIILKYGATTGGTDMISKLLNSKYKSFPMGQLMFAMDFLVIIASIILIGLDRGLYAIISVFISTMIIDVIIRGINNAKAFFIITEKPEAIAVEIMDKLERGVTSIAGKGVYTGGEKTVLMCAVNDRSEITTMKQLIKKCDASAFVLISDVTEILGEGFYDII